MRALRVTRRRFVSGVLGGGAICLVGGGVLAEASKRRWVFERAEMGVPFRVTVDEPGADPERVRVAAEAALDRVRALNAIFSDYEDDSEAMRLCRESGTGRRVAVSAEMAELLGFALDVAEETGGAFDVTVGPVVLLWRRARRQRVLPEGWRIERAMEAVGWGGVELDRGRRVVELKRKGMRLDFGGVAKGYAAREALKVLVERGFRSCMVAGSGDMAMGVAPQGAEGWKIRIAALEGASGEGEVVTLAERGIATSGDVNQFVELDGVRYSHVVDCRTGWALTRRVMATVVASDAMRADAYSKPAGIFLRDDVERMAKRHGDLRVWVQTVGESGLGVERFGGAETAIR